SVLFSREHQQWIDNIAQLGRHLKNADQYVNTSNTAGALILFELAKTAAEVGVGVGMGVVSPGAGASTAAGALGAYALARYLAKPATAAAMSAWAKAYRAVTLGTPRPAQIAVLSTATRNLANNLGLPAETVVRTIGNHAAGAADNQQGAAP